MRGVFLFGTLAMVAKLPPVLFTLPVLLEFFFGKQTPARTTVDDTTVAVGARRLPLLVVRNPRARRYLLRLRPDGTARVTIPRGGSLAVARQFVERQTRWLEKQLHRLEAQPRKSTAWNVGSMVLFRGENVPIEATLEGANESIRLGGQSLGAAHATTDFRPVVEVYLRRLAAAELPPRLLELAAQHGLRVNRVTVRNQKTRWGSCSRRGTISLNWRLIQTPPFVRDYIFLHELMHLRQMNHSARFWREVENVCPGFPAAERWLKQHSLAILENT